LASHGFPSMVMSLEKSAFRDLNCRKGTARGRATMSGLPRLW
jgi:hypothetical protein